MDKEQVLLEIQRTGLVAVVRADGEDEAARIAAEYRRTQATPEMLLGTAVVNGESPAFGFPPDTYLIAPSLRVYELFMWYDENERWTRN